MTVFIYVISSGKEKKEITENYKVLIRVKIKKQEKKNHF